MRRLRLLLPAAALTAFALAAPATTIAGGPSERRYEVKITNLTPTLSGTPGSQPFSPPVVAVHTRGADVVEPGRPASPELEGVAEDALNGPLVDALDGMRQVATAFSVDGGPIPSAASRTFTVSATRSFNRLSIVSMLVNTNDGFWALDAAKLKSRAQTHYLHAYDAGTEVNDQLADNIPGPCCGDTDRDGTDENDVVTMHPGLAEGVGDLDVDDYGWGLAPVAKVEISRVG